jgi:hypothetical protein
VHANDRKLQNELLFRDANEAIKRTQEDLGLEDGYLPFLCECFDEACRTIVHLTAAEYAAVRGAGRSFVIAPAHPSDDGAVAEQTDRYWVLDKEHT